MDNDTDDKFHKAVASKDLRTLWSYIDQQDYDRKYIVDQLIKNRWSMTDVVELGELEITKLFLESNDTVSVRDVNIRDGWTGLHRAAIDSKIDHVRFFLEQNADPNSMCDSGHTPLYCAYSEHYEEDEDHGLIMEIMKLLIAAGAKAITTRDNVNYLQVENALVEGNLETVEFVLNMDIDLRAHYYNGDTVMHYLAQTRHPDVLAKIRGRDFDINARNNYGQTPLFVAAEWGHDRVVEFLLSEVADVNVADNDNMTPLRVATQYYEHYGDSNMECIKQLLQHGANIQVIGTNNYSSTTIFDTILEFKDEEDTRVMYQLMLEHLALQEASGVKINEVIQNKIALLKKYFDFCKELLLMEFHESNTLLEMLCCSEEKLITYLRNPHLVCMIKHWCIESKLFPNWYVNLLQKRLDKANKTATLRSSAAIVVCKLMGINYNGYSCLVDSILRYLDDKDMEVLLSISHEII